MKNNFLTFLTALALAAGILCAQAQSATVATVPVGMITYPLASGTTSYLSLPLTNLEIYTGSVSAVTSNTISVGDSPAPFTSSLAAPAAPYFVKFLSGSQVGRVLLITANTTSTVTLDTTDHAIGSPVLLNTTGFGVAAGDTFEIFPGDTLASVFGAGTTASPSILAGSTSVAGSDTVSLFTAVNAPAVTYYFNTTAGCWEQSGVTGNANNTIIYPYSAFAVTRLASNAATALVLQGRVTSVAAEIKVVSNGTVYTSTQYATDVPLAKLQFGSNWLTGSSVATADTLSVWNASEGHFDTYYQEPDTTWRKYPDAVTDQSSVAISPGTVTTIAKRDVVSGGASFLQPAQLPYSLD
jgi:uncharacterized protein (TIGR02597 family)